MAEPLKQRIVPMPNPQSVVQFGFQGLKRQDPDFIPAYILNYVVGGGGFSSKLMQEVREKRGLAYSVHTYLYPLDHVGIFAGGVATENKSVGQSLELIKAEFDSAAKEGLTRRGASDRERLFDRVFRASFRHKLQNRGATLAIQLDDLGIDYIDRRNSEIEAVTVQRYQARRKAADGAEKPDCDRCRRAGGHQGGRALGSPYQNIFPEIFEKAAHRGFFFVHKPCISIVETPKRLPCLSPAQASPR